MMYMYGNVKNFRNRNRFLKAQWHKVQLLRDLLKDPFIPENIWIAWIDDDLVFNDCNATSMIDKYIHHYGMNASMVITSDTYP